MELEFELPAFQHKLSGFAAMKQGEPLTVTLESDTLLPDPAANSWLVPLRVTCAGDQSGRLPFGTWETRFLTGVSRIHGLLEDDFHTAIGQSIDVTIWNFRRLSLTPGDAVFGQWHESDVLMPTPYHYDHIVIECRLHRNRV